MEEHLRPPDRLLPARIAGQSGLVTRAQALDGGYSPARIRWMVQSGRWSAVHPGVYLTEPGRDDWETRAVAALLFVGLPAALSGVSAAHAWGLARADDEIHVIVPMNRRRTRRSGIISHRTRAFTSRVHPRAWPHRTTAEHTVLDLISGRDLDTAIAMVAKACQQGLTTEDSLLAALRSRPSQPHFSLLVEALADVGGGVHSAAELRYLRDVVTAHGLPRGRRQEPGPRSTARDTAYEEVKVIVEVDGRRGHQGWLGQQRDGRRDRGAAADGWLSVRVFWIDVAGTPCHVAVELGSIFGHRGWTGAVRARRRPDCAVRWAA
ncbi:MAG TPA: type IV toxin-antitoxin system AbiEi family antitoxin domain-containing protein [Intrasporangium sp.]|nr:type IV toxin-antitoxin system AbiEi family antitoxin domain-containing protein [Intrasporangium sp.]